MNAFTIYPAIDLKDGACVRLRQGEMEGATVYASDPGAQAKVWQDAGCRWIHVVDLNGAFAGKPVNGDAVRQILKSVTVPVQLGGGIRDMQGVAAWLDAGISRVILGSAALKNPALVRDACKAYPNRVVVGIDAKNGMVATEGWADVSDVTALDLAARFEDCGVAAIIYTDISRDGMLGGVNIEATLDLARHVKIPVIASGGIGGMDHLHALQQASAGTLEGVVIGRALYDGRIDLKAALKT
jgi:phosphoribosylformimino-5-aminoimidazole carboxamide ribotide isomerase